MKYEKLFVILRRKVNLYYHLFKQLQISDNNTCHREFV